MHTHDFDGLDLEVGRRGKEGAGPEQAGLAGVAEHRPDVLGRSGLLQLQRDAGNEAVSDLVEQQRSPVLDVVNSGGGTPLQADVRADMEGRLGADFSDVRVHTGSDAHESARSVGAHAYTVGTNVVFQRDAFDPSSDAGRTTLAHELTHVIQQRSGPVDGTPTASGVSVSNPGDRYERAAAENATRVMSAAAPAAASAAPVQRDSAGADAGASVQRAQATEEDEEESLQGSFVQREEAPTEEDEELGA
ncbi:DUF4157 domain-containing protein [Rathayibacter sp. YIM 133350]|uniref:eCIS core domain-containing protein n=1 Tax=Rathayibacter sp. YIM 133350 TaxID=3131992 RepID=UPI00307E44FB